MKMFRSSGSGTFASTSWRRSEEHTSELQSRLHLVCRLLLEKKKKQRTYQKNEDRAMVFFVIEFNCPDRIYRPATTTILISNRTSRRARTYMVDTDPV